MKPLSRFFVCLVLISALLSNALPCGPGYISPLFDTTSAPEAPYTDFAAGRLGIVKPKFHRSVLLAAYRWIAGGGLTPPEQQAIVEVWRAEIDNHDQPDDTIDEAVKAWVARRAEVVGEDKPTPEIYVERTYGGYDFFPNCTKIAFETATESLGDRMSLHGREDMNVANWLAGQDQVFANCASGKRTPDDAPPGAPAWLVKDRAYQRAAAEFYSMDHDAAKKHFAEIADDIDSPWAETAGYMVGRTLVRQASLSKDKKKSGDLYVEAEEILEKYAARGGKFSPSSERLLGLIKYRTKPRERVSELAKLLTPSGGNDNFRQDVIDYTWLLDKFELEILSAEEKRKRDLKEAEDRKNLPPCAAGMSINVLCQGERITNSVTNTITTSNATITNKPATNAANAAVRAIIEAAIATNAAVPSAKKNDDDATIYLTSEDYSKTWMVHIDRNATDAEALAEAEKVVGGPLSEELKKRVLEGRKAAYVGRFSEGQQSGYEGGYWGDEKLTPSLLPAFLKQDELTEWLFLYQTPGAEAYLHSLNKFKQGNSELWLMTALSKADHSSTQLAQLIEAGRRANSASPAYTTIAYHTARILLELNRTAEAKKLIDDILARGDQMPISARNSFLTMRVSLADTMDDFIRLSLKRPFAFDFAGDVGTIDQIIAEQKTYYDPEYNKDGRAAFEAEVDERYKVEREWQGREMFDEHTIDLFNQVFPTSVLVEVMRSKALPDHMRERFALAIWTRAFLLDDFATLMKITPELSKYRPDLAPGLEKLAAAKTQGALDHATLYFVLKNPVLSPFVEDGMGKTDNTQEQWDMNDWWCEPYDTVWNDETNESVPRAVPRRPAFLTLQQSQMAQTERNRLKKIGDAPKHLGQNVIDWARRYPTDRRVPEALYIMIEANGWTKYGCGNNEELRDEMTAILKRRYPKSEWTAKLAEEESEDK